MNPWWRHGPRSGPRRRPPWWPEDEAWPPSGGGREQWRARRGRFFRRMAFFAASFLIFTFGGATFLFWTLASAIGAVNLGDTVRGALLLLLFLGLAGVALTARGVRRFAARLDDVIDAAGRVESGDLSARVAERGPRELRALARAFNSMSERLESAEEQRRRLLADVTHELRTPLTVVQGNLEALLDHVYAADDAHLETILEETRVLSRLIDDLRTLSLAEAGALTLHREPIDLVALASETAASLRPHADHAGVALEVSGATDLPAADADPVRTKEVLANLLTNALRYTPKGGSVRVRVERDGDRIRISVRDTGAGISPDALPHVFDRFYKSDESRGAGLGLAIAKSLVVAHGGEIAAESTVGQGTEMRFTLPVAS